MDDILEQVVQDDAFGDPVISLYLREGASTYGTLGMLRTHAAVRNTPDKLVVLVHSVHLVKLQRTIHGAFRKEMATRKQDNRIYVQVDLFITRELQELHNRFL